MVRMRHEGVEQEIEVHEISVTQYERSGWTVVDLPEKAAAAKGRRRETGEN